MTGFGRGEYTGAIKQVIIEMKSVNHRYSEVIIRMPRQYTMLEETIRRYVLKEISRGRVEIFVKLENTSAGQEQVQVDKELALAYYKAMKELAAITGVEFNIGIAEIANMPSVLKIEETEENLDDIWKEIQPALQKALVVMLAMRDNEGKKLATDLTERLSYLQKLHKKIEEKSPLVVSQYQEKLHNRLKELLENEQIDENRLALEIALFADKSCIDEELVRLQSHFIQFQDILQESASTGRKLDFLIQEINREINTIGSKANDLEITKCVLEMKSELEKLREQVQNIE
jgi:uncharacterized protein (TIGR00255 family)